MEADLFKVLISETAEIGMVCISLDMSLSLYADDSRRLLHNLHH
jgi:hypothetical protein